MRCRYVELLRDESCSKQLWVDSFAQRQLTAQGPALDLCTGRTRLTFACESHASASRSVRESLDVLPVSAPHSSFAVLSAAATFNRSAAQHRVSAIVTVLEIKNAGFPPDLEGTPGGTPTPKTG